jgi:enterochelin esterase family protein
MRPLFSLICSLIPTVCTGAVVQNTPLTPAEVRAAIASNPTGNDAAALAKRVLATFNAAAVREGRAVRVSGLEAAWALEASAVEGTPLVVSKDGKLNVKMVRIEGTDLWIGAAVLKDGDAFLWHYLVSGKQVGGGQLEVYAEHPDLKEQPGVPKGRLVQQPRFESRVFPGTTRDWWIYIPAQYSPDKPACVMVFQDGGGYKDFTATVFDNLIAKGDMPVTVGIFLNPGTFADGRSNRSFEYDTLSDQYARFLLEEILPETEKQVKLRRDAASRAIAGASSGGICAFTVAWERPGEFSKVLSWVGSFTNIASGPTLRAGGHNYQALVRKTEPKPIRIFLQDGEQDLDNIHGNWPLANITLAKSLAFKNYDYKLVMGNGFHSNRHGRAIMPDSLRWLWRDWKQTVGS